MASRVENAGSTPIAQAAFSAFTPEERKAISAKIKILVAEGKPLNQAAAEAIRMVAPGKSTSKNAAEFTVAAGPAPYPPGKKSGAQYDASGPGVGYRATQNPDGTWNVYDVPIFAEYEDERRRPDKVTRKWLSNALAKFQARASEGYLPPLHVYHHQFPNGESRQTIPAGHYRLTRTGPIVYEGNVIQALFADYVDVPPAIYADMKAGGLPYRSVEFGAAHFDADNAEVDSLALLPDEVPFFRLPLLRIGSETPAAMSAPAMASAAHVHRTPGIARACFSDATGAAVLSCFAGTSRFNANQEAPMPDEKKPEEKPAEAPEEKKPEGDGAPAWASALHAKIDGFMAAMASMIPKPAAAEAAVEKEPEPEAKEPAAEAAYVDGKGTPAIPPVAAAQFAALQGQVRGLEAKFASIENEKKRGERAEKAKADLAQFALGSTWKDEVDRLAGDEGALAAYVAGVKSSAPKTTAQAHPAATQAAGAGAGSGAESPAIARYSDAMKPTARRLLA